MTLSWIQSLYDIDHWDPQEYYRASSQEKITTILVSHYEKMLFNKLTFYLFLVFILTFRFLLFIDENQDFTATFQVQ